VVVASLWEPLLVGMLVVVTAVLAGLVVAAFLLWRYGRRKWRAFHSHGLVVAGLALWEATSSRRSPRSTWSPDDVYGWTSRQVRRELWRSVDRAGSAVEAAEEADGSTASLPDLCRRLREVAARLDRVLRIDGQRLVPPDVAAQAIEVMQAASDVQRAAMASASDANGQRVKTLVRDADPEIRCVDAGLASAQAVFPPTEH
jgi:hypothetical protein